MNAAAAVAMFILSCAITLNPDGSGKAVVEVRQSAPAAGAGGAKAAPTLDEKLALARKVLSESRGVETWTDLSVAATPDGQITFKGTAYFKDLNSMGVGPQPGTPPVTWNKDEKAGGALKFVFLDRQVPPAPVKLTPDELARQTTAVRETWKQMRAALAEDITSSIMDVSYKLPGEPIGVEGFRKDAGGTLHIKLDGPKLLATVDALVADDKAVGEALQTTGGMEDSPDDVIQLMAAEKMFGTRLPLTASVKGEMKPQFDYVAEVAAIGRPSPAAAEQVEALVKQLGAGNFAQRDEAEKKLAELARTQDVREVLRKHADDPDPEVRSRARNILAASDAVWVRKGGKADLEVYMKALAAKAAAEEKQQAAPKAAAEK